MKLLAICACPTGVAHTYMAKSALEEAASKLGHTIKVEAQGALGIENEITFEEAAAADILILATEVGISKAERFENVKKVELPIQMVVKNAEAIIKKIEEQLGVK